MFWISLVGLAVFILVTTAKNGRLWRSSLLLFLLSACGAAYFFTFQSGVSLSSKGERSDDLVLIGVLYGCVLLGMVCDYLYALVTRPKSEREGFEVGAFLAPLLVSPIVFIPLLEAFQSIDIDLANLTRPKFMVFLVAFENGFFWRVVFEKRVRRKWR